MKTETCFPKRARFHHRHPDNSILVQNSKDGVLIRATHDTFSEPRKAAFIRELVAEGFIPEHYQWFAEPGTNSFLGIKWVIDDSWIDEEYETTQTESLGAPALLLAALVWLILIILIVTLPH